MADPIRVLVADDHPLILEAIVAILQSVPDFEVVGTTDEAGRAVDFVAEHKPRVVVMDILMPGVDSFQAVDEIRRLSPGTDVIFVSGADHDVMLEQARRCGSIGFVSKADGPQCVEDAIRAAMEGETYYSPSLRDRIREGLGDRLSKLTGRELEVLRYIARGFSKKEIGGLMHLSVKTIDRHATSLMAKLDIHDRVELARFAIREGLVSPES
ncbi:MAG: response regulator transcription factor [Planctomycetota bacterium]